MKLTTRTRTRSVDWRTVIPTALYYLMMTAAGLVISLLLTGRLWS